MAWYIFFIISSLISLDPKTTACFLFVSSCCTNTLSPIEHTKKYFPWYYLVVENYDEPTFVYSRLFFLALHPIQKFPSLKIQDEECKKIFYSNFQHMFDFSFFISKPNNFYINHYEHFHLNSRNIVSISS